MPQFMRRSLMVQLVSVYLIFVAVVLISGVGVNTVAEQHLRDGVQTSDQALAQDIALETSLNLIGAEQSLVKLGALALHAPSTAVTASDFQAFMAARTDVDHVYWLDPLGAVQLSITSPLSPPDTSGIGAEFSPPTVIEQVRTATRPVIEVGIAEETTLTAGVIIAAPVRDTAGNLVGIVATSLSLEELSSSLAAVVGSQHQQGQHLQISIIDSRGELIATPDHRRILDTVLDELPGADQALRGHNSTLVSPGPDNQDWLFSAVPVPATGWAVVVQRPADEALAVVAQLHLWLLAAALLFAVGGLVFWLMLLNRVIRPLHALSHQHRSLPASPHWNSGPTVALAQRRDEVGILAQSLERLEHDVLAQLGELGTLLETSTAVVGSLEPRAVVGTIIQEVRRLVDVQAAAVLVPDEQGVLKVLVSDGHSERYDQVLSLTPENVSSSAVLALRDGQPVQKLLDPELPHPAVSAEEGFRAVLAIPIISRHAGGVVLLVHRTEPQPFTKDEIDLLLTFANYATLAWEHAVLYERSDERLREVARENEQLYEQANAERQTLAAIMGSMSDGLILTSIEDRVLYANRGASSISGIHTSLLEGSSIEAVHAALRARAERPDDYDRDLRHARAGERPSWLLETAGERPYQAIHLRLFDVHDDSGQIIGRGLLLRDVTRERELDQFKTTLLAAVGHELRTPLASIKGYASTLLQEDVVWPVDDQRAFLQTISTEADRLARLVSNLLDLTRLEAGLLALRREPASLADLIESAVGRLGQPASVVDIKLPDDLPLLTVDSARIEVVLNNLLTNALAYGEGHVRVSAAREEQSVVVRIADDGPGISQEELPHIFERFYRAQRGRQQHSGGTGLGLAICKAFIEAHAGAIWAESSPTGTTIAFSLPIEQAAPATPAPQANALEAERVEQESIP